MSIIWHNGDFKNETDALLNASDRSLRGHGVFDTMLVIDGRLSHADKHFTRLIHDAATMGIKQLPTQKDLQQNAIELLHENSLTEGRHALNSVITAGSGKRGLRTPNELNPQIIIRASALPDEFPPITAIISKTVRRNEGSPLSQIKSINYGDNILALNEAVDAGANEALMINNAGNVACATIGNIFITVGGELYTPPLSDGAMAGITRELLINNHGAKEKTITLQELNDADGIYISNSIRGLSAITSLSRQHLPIFDLDIPKDFHE